MSSCYCTRTAVLVRCYLGTVTQPAERLRTVEKLEEASRVVFSHMYVIGDCHNLPLA